jgi:hypothetical protein
MNPWSISLHVYGTDGEVVRGAPVVAASDVPIADPDALLSQGAIPIP